MKKKDITFIIGLTILMGVTWIIGELVMGLWIAVMPRTHIIWFAVIVTITLAISIWHSFIEDKSDLEDPKRAKYERKVNKRKNKN
ncbi:hypothetical protein [Ruminococcus sp.]|jgi:uncharacterized membrane protein|uniref:hypothetical protein n=1 Tax=Ruminococcus sp. TaxID=41978 RepID=UPI0025FDC512|nr:hypothetical protein [Ruminococcus sp.]